MEEQPEEQQVNLDEVLEVRPRYKSTKGDNDRRKGTSKSNIAKARQAKRDKLKLQPEEKAYQYIVPGSYLSESSSTDSSSDSDELVITKKKSKAKQLLPSESDATSDRIGRIEQAILQLAKDKKKKKKRVIEKRAIIHMSPPQSAPSTAAKKRLLLDLQ